MRAPLRKVPDLTFPFDATPRQPLLNWGALAWMLAVVAFWAAAASIILWLHPW